MLFFLVEILFSLHFFLGWDLLFFFFLGRDLVFFPFFSWIFLFSWPKVCFPTFFSWNLSFINSHLSRFTVRQTMAADSYSGFGFSAVKLGFINKSKQWTRTLEAKHFQPLFYSININGYFGRTLLRMLGIWHLSLLLSPPPKKNLPLFYVFSIRTSFKKICKQSSNIFCLFLW